MHTCCTVIKQIIPSIISYNSINDSHKMLCYHVDICILSFPIVYEDDYMSVLSCGRKEFSIII